MARKKRIQIPKTKKLTQKTITSIVSKEHGLELHNITIDGNMYIFDMTDTETKKEVKVPFSIDEILDSCDGVKTLRHFGIEI